MGSNTSGVNKGTSKQPPSAAEFAGMSPEDKARAFSHYTPKPVGDWLRGVNMRANPTPGMGVETMNKAAPNAGGGAVSAGDSMAYLGGSRTFNEDTGTYNTPAVNPDYLGGSKAPDPYADLTMANFYGTQPVQQPITQSLADPYMPRAIMSPQPAPQLGGNTGLPNTGYQPSPYTYQPYPDTWTPPPPAPAPAPLTVPQQATQSILSAFLRR